MRRNLLFGLAAVVLALAFLPNGTADIQADAQEGSSAQPKVQQEVFDALETEAWVEVFVALREPAAARAASVDLPALRQQVAADQEDVLSDLTDADFQVIHGYDAIPSLFGRVSAAGAEKLAAHPNVVRVYLPLELHYTLTQSVPLINADDVHTLGYTGEGVVVSPLDSGIDTDHSDLQDDLIGQHCYADAPRSCPGGVHEAHGAGSAEDPYGHGTHVAGIVTSGGVVAPTGVAPDADLIFYRIGDASGPSMSGALKALDRIINNPGEGVRAINMSFGGGLYTPPCDVTFPDWATALNTLRTQGVISFVASGNDANKSQMIYPACLSAAVSVGAVYDANVGTGGWGICTDPITYADLVTCFSNSHAQLDLLAPGSVIYSSYLYNGATNLSGTSMAAPHAMAVAALMFEANPAATPDQIESCMKTTGVPVTDPANGVTTPRVDALAAVQCIAPTVPNDDFGNATAIPGVPYSNSQATCDATVEAGEPNCGGPSLEDTVWYKYYISATRDLVADTFGSDYDTQLMVYSGPDPATFPDLTCVGWNDDTGGLQSEVSFTASAGTTYYFQIDGFAGECGNLVFNLYGTGACPEVIGNGCGIAGDDTTDPAMAPDCDNDGLSDADEVTGAACGGIITDPGPDITYDDNNNGNPSSLSCFGCSDDPADDPPAWDSDGDGARDGAECALGTDPTNAADRPTVAQCGGTGDFDGDGLKNAWESCKWGSNSIVIDSDGDGTGDCVEAADVDGNGVVDFVADNISYAKAALLPAGCGAGQYGKDGDFDMNGDGIVDFVADVMQEAKFALGVEPCL
jgi:subtilisin